MNSRVNNTCSNAFYYLYNIRRIRKYLSEWSTETLIHAFVSSRVDYCNSLLYGLPTYQLNTLQRVQNAAAMLIFQESKYRHVRPLQEPITRSLHLPNKPLESTLSDEELFLEQAFPRKICHALMRCP